MIISFGLLLTTVIYCTFWHKGGLLLALSSHQQGNGMTSED